MMPAGSRGRMSAQGERRPVTGSTSSTVPVVVGSSETSSPFSPTRTTSAPGRQAPGAPRRCRRPGTTPPAGQWPRRPSRHRVSRPCTTAHGDTSGVTGCVVGASIRPGTRVPARFPAPHSGARACHRAATGRRAASARPARVVRPGPHRSGPRRGTGAGLDEGPRPSGTALRIAVTGADGRARWYRECRRRRGPSSTPSS